MQSCKTSTSSTVTKVKSYAAYLGNTNGNIQQGGYAVVAENILYYVDVNNTGNLYALNLDTKKSIKLSKRENCREISIVDDWVYYISGGPATLYRVSSDGRKEQRLTKRKVNGVKVTDSYLFYVVLSEISTSQNGDLYRMNHDGSEEVLIGHDVREYAVGTESVYFYQSPWYGSSTDCGLFKMDFNGDGIGKLLDDSAYCINICDDYVYYISGSTGAICRVKTDGTMQETLLYDRCRSLNVFDLRIYYYDEEREGLYSMSLDGKDNRQIVSGFVSRVNVTNRFLLYRISSDGENVYYSTDLSGNNSVIWNGYMQ